MPTILMTPDTSSIREETFEGKTHMVVPLIALVEGVLSPANAGQAELAPASEFGKFPSGWNGRPVTMGHPKVNNQFVSANSPQVLSDWAIGHLFNTHLEDKKLKTEAWINIDRANELNDDSKDLIDRLEGEEVIEVSTGLFVEVIEVHGIHEGNEFEGIWSDIVPDHLAMLPAGVTGACSVEAGCGAPRLNVLEGTAGGGGRAFRAVTLQLQSQSGGVPLPAGDSRDSGDNGDEPYGESGRSTEGEPKMAEPAASTDHGIGDDTKKKKKKKTNAQIRAETAKRCRSLSNAYVALAFPESEAAGTLSVNEFPSDMPIDDVRKILFNALETREDIDLFSVRTFTREQVVFEIWDDMKFRSMEFEMTSEGEVTFTSDPIEVNLLTRISPRVNASDGDETMAGEDDTKAITPVVAPNTEGASPAEPSKAPLVISSMTELIPKLSPELRASIETGQVLMNERVDGDVAKVLANQNNAFSEAELREMDPRILTKMAGLAEVPPVVEEGTPKGAAEPTANLTGRAAPVAPRVSQDTPPPPPEAFPRKGANGSANSKEG